MKRPPALRPGDRIGIAAPASCFPRETFDAGVQWLIEQGFQVSYRDDLFVRHHYLAGSIERRVEELHQMMADPELRAIFFARGGYGLMQLLSRLELDGLAAHPKIVLGYSDLTPLLNLIPARLGLVAFHGPLVAGLHRTRQESLEHLLATLTRADQPPPPIGGEGVATLRGGRVTAPLCGGSLTLIASTLGTPFQLDARGKILCLEDVGERPYRVDRMLQQLELAGMLRGAAGIAVGEFVDCQEPGGRGRPLEEIFEHFLGPLKVPVVYGLPFGHGAVNETLPLGADAELDADRGLLRVTAPVVD